VDSDFRGVKVVKLRYNLHAFHKTQNPRHKTDLVATPLLTAHASVSFYSLLLQVLLVEKMQDFKKLKVYQEAYDLSKEVYKELKDVKGNFRLKEQLFGSTTAVCANLAEMSAFENKNQQKQKVTTCLGEANETEFWLNFCKDSGLLTEDKFKEFVNKLKVTRMMLFNLHKSIKQEINQNVQTTN
jgi:four helix bundle protein